MEIALFLIFLIIFAVISAIWADFLGRRAWVWVLVTVLISPMVAWLLLLILGKTQELKDHEEAKRILKMKELLRD